jgi:ABC-type oligopeptide transport system substrate-binding subunit
MTTENGPTKSFDVFVSYSTKDKVVADAVVAAHEQEGIRCWYAPRDIAPGADWADSITQAIQKCAMMVLVFSENANRSQRVIDEINYAISAQKPILPFRIEPHNPSGALSLHLSSRHWLDAYEPSWEEHINRLVRSVEANLSAVSDEGGEPGGVIVKGETAGGMLAPQVRKRNPIRVVAGVLGLIAVLSIAGVYMWNNLGGDSAASPSTPAATQTGKPPEATPTDAVVEAVPTEVNPFTASLNGYFNSEEFSLDPQRDTSHASITLIENMFINLTSFDMQSSSIMPEAAEHWTISPDGTIYTFTLRSDIPWVTHTLEGETVQAVDEEGQPRYLSAHEFEYAYKRLCDPSRSTIIPPLVIENCREAYEYEDPENIPPEYFENIGVDAVSDTELIFKLDHPSSAFLSTTCEPGYTALPFWAMEKYGEAWTNPGLIPTNGPFVIDQWVLGEKIRLLRNPLFPQDLAGAGNIQTVELLIMEDVNEIYDLWKKDQIDYAEIPPEELPTHLDQYPDETEQLYGQFVRYLVFQLDRPPFDDVHLRRAFSAAFDRESFVEQELYGQGVPMIHLAPAGVFGAPPVDEVGVGYDPEFARSELGLAGYPNCRGLPQVEFVVWSGVYDFMESTVRSLEENLGCEPGTINFTSLTPGSEIPQSGWDILTMGWRSDYPDEDDWLGKILYCEDALWWHSRECNEIDELILQARQETAAADRIELYRQIEQAFFGYDGTYPIAPLYAPAQYVANQHWLERTQSIFNLEEYMDWSVDMQAKQEALGR